MSDQSLRLHLELQLRVLCLKITPYLHLHLHPHPHLIGLSRKQMCLGHRGKRTRPQDRWTSSHTKPKNPLEQGLTATSGIQPEPSMEHL